MSFTWVIYWLLFTRWKMLQKLLGRGAFLTHRVLVLQTWLLSYMLNVCLTANCKMQFGSWVRVLESPTTESYSLLNILFQTVKAATYYHHHYYLLRYRLHHHHYLFKYRLHHHHYFLKYRLHHHHYLLKYRLHHHCYLLKYRLHRHHCLLKYRLHHHHYLLKYRLCPY